MLEQNGGLNWYWWKAKHQFVGALSQAPSARVAMSYFSLRSLANNGPPSLVEHH